MFVHINNDLCVMIASEPLEEGPKTVNISYSYDIVTWELPIHQPGRLAETCYIPGI